MVYEPVAQNLVAETDSQSSRKRLGLRRAAAASVVVLVLGLVFVVAAASWSSTSNGFLKSSSETVGLSAKDDSAHETLGQSIEDDSSDRTADTAAEDASADQTVAESVKDDTADKVAAPAAKDSSADKTERQAAKDASADETASVSAKDGNADDEIAAACNRDVKEFAQRPAADCVGCTIRHGGITPAAYECAKARGEEAQLKVSWFGAVVEKHTPGAIVVDDGFGDELPSDPSRGWSMFDSLGKWGTDYTRFPLVGSRFSVDVDLGNPGASCGCNVALFFISAPSAKKSEWGNYYCDANCVGGNCCAEFDLMEMNVHSLVVTSHTCTDYQKPPFNSQPWACDHAGGPSVYFGNGKLDYGPGAGFTIDSTKKFKYIIEFPEEDGILRGNVTLVQGEVKVSARMENLESMRAAFSDGMALDADSWFAENILWLDGAVCTLPEACNRKSATFDRLVIESLAAPAPAPAPATAPAPAPAPAPSPEPSPDPAPSPGPGPDPSQNPSSDKDCPETPGNWAGYCRWIEEKGCDKLPDDGVAVLVPLLLRDDIGRVQMAALITMEVVTVHKVERHAESDLCASRSPTLVSGEHRLSLASPRLALGRGRR
eukprot:CAMPEP_0170306928 /NCGR_PEP_ID=MMETSP0116_2-20130129/53868_1 /TAXON_ID=400756 /ORGANISM="Durinskia baltica, Strain CSIRO CS-38" /LENGTH=601 /DNA_ID=CAMNT_0010559039 /DNA_START=74 /DNA_END=1878 /DNA_ORIENTATION=+